MSFEPGTLCTVNGFGDLMMDRSAGQLVGKDCVIIKRLKSGLIQVALEDDPSFVKSLPQRNIEPRNSDV